MKCIDENSVVNSGIPTEDKLYFFIGISVIKLENFVLLISVSLEGKTAVVCFYNDLLPDLLKFADTITPCNKSFICSKDQCVAYSAYKLMQMLYNAFRDESATQIIFKTYNFEIAIKKVSNAINRITQSDLYKKKQSDTIVLSNFKNFDITDYLIVHINAEGEVLELTHTTGKCLIGYCIPIRRINKYREQATELARFPMSQVLIPACVARSIYQALNLKHPE